MKKPEICLKIVSLSYKIEVVTRAKIKREAYDEGKKLMDAEEFN